MVGGGGFQRQDEDVVEKLKIYRDIQLYLRCKIEGPKKYFEELE